MRIMGLSLLNPEFPSPAGRFLLFTTKVMNRTFPSKIYLIFFLDTANLEINPCSKKNSEVKRTRIIRIERMKKISMNKNIKKIGVGFWLFSGMDGGFGWKPIASEARVTRDEVSGL